MITVETLQSMTLSLMDKPDRWYELSQRGYDIFFETVKSLTVKKEKKKNNYRVAPLHESSV